MIFHLPLLWALLSILALIPHSFASVLAIDYGTDWIKASLMKPGVPFDVLLNKDSKRKIQSSVAWKKNDRLFGQDAFNLASRFPTDSFSSLKYLQGAPYDSDAVSFYASISTAELAETSRKTVSLKASNGMEWSVEELIGMQLSYVKELAETLAGEKVYDVIVTVPPYYSQFERDAVADAIELAGLRTLALINDGTAVAVNYAMTRTFPTPEYHIVYDAGASAIRATVVSFNTVSEAKGTHISVAGVGYDRMTGGNELDRRVREILVDNFVNKHKKDIRSDKRGMAKLWKEAGRVKAILSANSEASTTIESIAWDIDFRTKVTRSTFEAACEDLKSRFSRPIYDALNNAGLTLDNITSVILTGGSTRTPMIQAAVKNAVGEDKMSLNVNADESAVLGAALHGATLSRQFKTKNIRVSDIGAHHIQATYHATSSGSSETPRTISSMIFPAGSRVGNKKTMTFKRRDDFSVHLDYKSPVAPGFPTQILEAQITGVADALATLAERGAVDPVVKATITLSESGFVSVSDAVAYGEIKDDSITGMLKGLFGSSSNPPSEEETPLDSDLPLASSADPQLKAAQESLLKNLPLEELSTIPLNISVIFSSIPPLTVQEKLASRNRLRAVDSIEIARNRREEARNTLESYLYKMRDVLDEDSPENPFMKCSQNSERKAIAAKLQELMSWVQEHGDAADTSELLDKRNTLEVLERPIIHRYQEIEAFPQALNNSQMWNWSTRMFLKEARTNLTAEEEAGLPSKWTKADLDSLEKELKDHERWLNEWVEKQKSVKMNEDPVINTTEMKARAKTLETHLMKMVRRKAPKVKKTPKSATQTSTTTEESTAATDPVPEPTSEEVPEVERPQSNESSHTQDEEHIRDEL